MNILYFLIATVYAQAPNGVKPEPPLTTIPTAPATGLGGIMGWIINILFAVAGGITMIVLIILGYKMFSAKGNEEEFKKALHGVTYAAVGLTVLGISYAIVAAIMGLQFF